MFRQLCHEEDARQLFGSHPLLISTLVEIGWGRRPASAFTAWPDQMTARIVGDFYPKGVPQFILNFINRAKSEFDHLIYAYCIENTGIFEIFYKVMEAYQWDEQLGTPSLESQRFLRNTADLIYSDPPPTTIAYFPSRASADDVALRMSAYWRLFGLELPHADEVLGNHPYQKAAAANQLFIETFEAFGREVRRGIINRRNFAGPNTTDNPAIASQARGIQRMLCIRREHDNLSREEFRAVAVMSWLHLAVSFNSPVVLDLKAEASSPEDRLCKIALRVGMKAHPKSKAFFDLAHPFSVLLRQVETGLFNDAAGAQLLYNCPSIRENADLVIEEYSLAMERDLKAMPVSVKLPTPKLTMLPTKVASRQALIPGYRG